MLELKELFPASLQHQIIDVTPDLSVNEGTLVIGSTRTAEVLAWLSGKTEVTHWAALDDEPKIFPGLLDRVVLTQSSEGITSEILDKLTLRFA